MQYHDIEGGYQQLIAAILEVGAKHPDYFREPCGVWWCHMGRIDPEGAHRIAVKGTKLEGIPYKAMDRCVITKNNQPDPYSPRLTTQKPRQRTVTDG